MLANRKNTINATLGCCTIGNGRKKLLAESGSGAASDNRGSMPTGLDQDFNFAKAAAMALLSAGGRPCC
jgi:hypothetical protein